MKVTKTSAEDPDRALTELGQTLRKEPAFKYIMDKLFRAETVAGMISISKKTSLLKNNPVSLGRNFYTDIVELGLEKAEPLTILLSEFCWVKEKGPSPEVVLKLAGLFASMAAAFSQKNSAFGALRGLALREGHATEEVVDSLGRLGMPVKTMDGVRKDIRYLSGISQMVEEDRLKAGLPVVWQGDNIEFAGSTGRMIHQYLVGYDVEQISTDGLSAQVN